MQVMFNPSSVVQIPKARIAIVHGEYYQEQIDRMIEACREVLATSGCEEPDVYAVPGCVELPLATRRVAQLGKGYEAIICFGIIIKGDSYHFDIVLDIATRGLAQVMMEEDIPVIIQILPADSMAIIDARTGADELNKGIEAAIAAAKIIAWRREHDVPGLMKGR
jgi:6,7-dimethyl-8-ribityllumazine synthase